jgi:hypothetical protein
VEGFEIVVKKRVATKTRAVSGKKIARWALCELSKEDADSVNNFLAKR